MSVRAVLPALLLAACAGEAPPTAAAPTERVNTATCAEWGAVVSGVAFTDEQAQNAVDLVDYATEAELETITGIGPSIASRIVAARPFGSQAEPLAALDAVSYVGDSVLTALRDEAYGAWCALADGRQACCVDIGCAGLGDTVSGVTFSDADARAVLDWANGASTDDLTSVCSVGAAIAADIEAARPLRTVAQLDAVPYVGASVLHSLVGDEGYTCQSKPSVLDGWCAAPDALCTCDETDEVAAPVDFLPTCTDATWPGYGHTAPAGAHTSYNIYTVDELKLTYPEVGASVEGLLGAHRCEGASDVPLTYNTGLVYKDAAAEMMHIEVTLLQDTKASVTVTYGADSALDSYVGWAVGTTPLNGIESISSFSEMPAELQTLVRELESSPDLCEDGLAELPVWIETLVERIDGAVVDYEVVLRQMVDSDSALAYVITVHVTPDFVITDHECAI